MGLVWKSSLPRDMKFIALANADHANDDGTSVFPSRKSVARMTGYSDRSVQLITHQLVSAGILVEEGESRYGTRQYRFDLDALAAYKLPLTKGGEEISPGEEKTPGGAKKAAERGEETSPNPSISNPSKRHPSKSRAVLLIPFSSDDLPPPLNTDEMKDVWDIWQEHLRKKGCPLTPDAARMQVKKLREMGHDRAIVTVQHSIEKNWRSLHEPRHSIAKAATNYDTLTAENAI